MIDVKKEISQDELVELLVDMTAYDLVVENGKKVWLKERSGKVPKGITVKLIKSRKLINAELNGDQVSAVQFYVPSRCHYGYFVFGEMAENQEHWRLMAYSQEY